MFAAEGCHHGDGLLNPPDITPLPNGVSRHWPGAGAGAAGADADGEVHPSVRIAFSSSALNSVCPGIGALSLAMIYLL